MKSLKPLCPSNSSGSYQGCFVCGKENAQGLKLDFFHDEETDEVSTRCSFPPTAQGYEGVVHGGFISMLLDEVMAKACLQKKIPAVTGKIEVRFKKPVHVEEEVEFRGRVLEVRGKKIIAEARCLSGAGEGRALAEGLFIRAG